MVKLQELRLASAAGIALALGACGGGGGGGSGIHSTPTPAPSPSPTPTPSSGVAIGILAAPASQEFAALTSAGSTGDLRIRFDAATGFYDVLVDSAGWQPLRPSSAYSSTPNHYFAYGPTDPDTSGFFQVSATAADPAPINYQYSSLAGWGTGVGAYWDPLNVTAFGIATVAGAVPVSGSAAYQGQILGESNVLESDLLVGGPVAASVSGSVALNFDFGAGALSGSMHPYLNTLGGPVDLGALAFGGTVYSSGSPTFSGSFSTALAGPNAFNGQFTGPAAQELIGRWAFPFFYPGDSTIHAATGAWIAKR